MQLGSFKKKPSGIAAISAMGTGSLVHLFGLINVLHNYDDIAQQPKGYGTGITSGRWFLSALGDLAETLGGNYNLPLINGVLFLVLIALSAGCMVHFLSIRNVSFAAMTGMLMAAFPSAFSTLVFRYTSVYYGIGILLSVLAACCVNNKKYGLLLSGLCTACSLGIYQAYAPITISLFVLKLVQYALEGKTSFWKLVWKGIYFCLALIFGLIFYYILLKVFLALYGTELSGYQGVDQMGQISLQTLPLLLKEAMYSVVMLPLRDYCGVTGMKLLKVAYLLIGCISAAITAYILLFRIRRWDVAFFVAAMFVMLPIAVNFVVIMCPDSWIYTLMIYSFVLIPCVPVVLFECLAIDRTKVKRWLSNGIGIILAVVIACYSYQTNINYTAMHYSNRQIENYVNSLVTQVRMTEGFHSQLEWVLLGEIDDPLLSSYWQYEMSYGGIEFTEPMLQRYSMGDWIQHYYGYMLPVAEKDRKMQLAETDEVKSMPCWPDYGSVKVTDRYVVIKFGELTE